MMKDQKEYGYSGLNIEQLIVVEGLFIVCLMNDERQCLQTCT